MRSLLINSLFSILTCTIISVQADYFIILHLEALSNSRFLLADGRCCSDLSLMENCPSACEDRLQICLRDAEHPRLLDTCPLLNIGNLPTNPRILNLPTIAGPWPMDGVQLLITITDSNSGELVDTVIHGLMRTPGNASQTIDAEGDRGLVDLTFSFEVKCDGTFFGPECNTVCIERDDSGGHFTCNPDDGSIVCLPGYRNVTSNCSECATAEGCFEEGGFCEGPGECLCREGYSGINCAIAPTSSFTFSLLPSTSSLPMTSDVDLLTTSSVPTDINLLTTSNSLVSSTISSPLPLPQSTTSLSIIMTPSPSLTTTTILAGIETSSPSTESSTTLLASMTITSSTLALSTSLHVLAPVFSSSRAFTSANVMHPKGLSPGATVGLTVGILFAIIILILIAIAAVIIVFFFILKRRHRVKARRWYLTESTNSTMEPDIVANKYASGTQLIPNHNGTSSNGKSSTLQPEMKSVNQNRPWYHETESELPSILRFMDDPVAPAYDTETIFSDATFDTLSRQSAVSENVVYADVVKPKPWIKELTSDEEKEEEEEEEEEERDEQGEEEIQDAASKIPPSQRISYAEVTF